jgi:type IV secretion system protein VirB4
MFKNLFPSSIPTVGDHVPLEEPLTHRTLRLSDGGAFAMLELDGWNSETADVVDINDRLERFNNTLRNISSSDRLILTSYVCRGLADPDGVATPHHALKPWAKNLANDYRDRLIDGRLYTNKVFLGIHLRPATRGNEWWSRRKAKKGKQEGGERAIDRAKRLEDISDWLMSELSDYGPRSLGLEPRGRQVFSQIAEALAFAVTGVWRPIALTTGRLADVMFCEEVCFHHETVEMRGPAHTVFSAALSFKEYPAVTWPGMFNPLLSAPLRFTFAHHFEPLPGAAGMNLLTRKQNKMVWAGDKAKTQIADLDTAADDLQSSRMSMGKHCALLTVFADRASGSRSTYKRLVDSLNTGLRSVGLGSLAIDVVRDVVDTVAGPPGADPLADVVNEAWKRLSGCGPTVVRESRAMMAAWLSMIPGNHRFRARPGACSSRNFAAMAPMHGFAKGMKRSRWGEPIAILRTSGGTPYPFHWHDGEGDDAVGGTLITGDTGSGKTAGAGYLISQTAGRANIIALDHKRGWHPLILHLGGHYTILGNGKPMFAPLRALDNTPNNLNFLYELYRGCIVQGGWRDLTPEEDRLLTMGIETVMEGPPEERELAEVVRFLSPDVDVEGAGARLVRWCWGNELGWVLDAPQCGLDLSGGIVGLDTTDLLANSRASAPALLYLFFMIARRLDGIRPLLLPIDEGWKAMEDDSFAEPIAAQVRTIRSKNGAVVFITQSPGDLASTKAGKIIVELSPNQLHFPNPRTTRENYTDDLKRTEGEYEALRGLHKGSGRFLICKGKDSLVAELPLHGMDQLGVLSASEASLRVLDSLPADVQGDPERLCESFARGRVMQKMQRETVG